MYMSNHLVAACGICASFVCCLGTGVSNTEEFASPAATATVATWVFSVTQFFMSNNLTVRGRVNNARG